METDGAKEGIRLWDLRSSTCHWPLGGLLDHVEFFCGQPTEPGCPYCREHRKRAFVRTHAAVRRDRPPFEIRPKEKPPAAGR